MSAASSTSVGQELPLPEPHEAKWSDRLERPDPNSPFGRVMHMDGMWHYWRKKEEKSVSKNKIYLIGSLRNEKIPFIGKQLREEGYEVFDDWFAGGKIADDEWQKYETDRGHNYGEALNGYAARHVFDFDYAHIQDADVALLVMPAGKSGHLEFGYMVGIGKPGFVLFEKEPDRWDIMYQFANDVLFNFSDLLSALHKYSAGFNSNRRDL